MFRFISIGLLIIIITSCQKTNLDSLTLFITPTSQYEIRNSGEIINFNIEISSGSDIEELLIIETINNSTIDTLVNKSLSGTSVQESFLYTTPNILEPDTSSVTLLFYCKNLDGKIAQRAKIIYVVSSDILLNETTGHTMYSSNSNKFNAYDLINGIPLFNSDSTSHINDNTDSLSDVLSRMWISSSGLSFAKFNSFDYANATNQTLENAYEISLKQEFVDNIVSDDIIITKIVNQYIVIKVIYVVDDIGVEDDKYIFSIKQ